MPYFRTKFGVCTNFMFADNKYVIDSILNNHVG